MSLSSPPPYSFYVSTSGSSSSSGSRKSLRKHRSNTSHDPEKDTADLRSIASGHSGSTARTQLSSRSDTLKMAIRTDLADKKGVKVTRRARCTPEFLEEIAKTGAPHNLKTRAESSFRVVYGLEAETLFDQFVGELASGDEKALRDYGRQYLSNPVVFAFSFIHAGRRMVDYYMTWRGKVPRIRDRRDHRRSFLDSEFKRVAKSLDQHYKNIISVVDNSTPTSEPARLPETSKRHQQPPKPQAKEEPPEPPKSPSAVSATDSVVSLPLLNMVRNVPFGNRQLLRVTNPDRTSILSDADTPAPSTPRILETIAEAAETVTAPLTESPTALHTSAQADVGKSPKSRHRPSSVKENRKSHSDGSRTNPDKEKKSSGAKDERRHSSHSHEERKHRSDDDASHKHSSKRHHHDKDKDRNKDKDKDKDRHDKSDSEAASEFTIVLLDDQAEKDLLSWHGLNRTDVNTTPRPTVSINDSPWTGPLVNANKIIFHTQSRQGPVHETPFTDDEESDEDDYEYWQGNTSVIPPGFLDGMQPFTSPAPSMPVPLPYTGSNYSSASPVPNLVRSTSSRQSYRTAYTYPVHRSPSASSTSSYVPAWIDPRHYDTPLTVMQTPLSYHTATPY